MRVRLKLNHGENWHGHQNNSLYFCYSYIPEYCIYQSRNEGRGLTIHCLAWVCRSEKHKYSKYVKICLSSVPVFIRFYLNFPDTYIKDNIRVTTVEFAVVLLWPVFHLEFLKKPKHNHQVNRDIPTITNIYWPITPFGLHSDKT